MSLSNFNMPFHAQNIPLMPMRSAPSKYILTPLGERFRFMVSEGIHPAEYLGVYRYLPVMNFDKTTEDYIVIPKGRIVSALCQEDTVFNFPMTVSGDAGFVYTFKNAITDLYSGVNFGASYYGYDSTINGINGFLVPANGGTQTTHYYTAHDITAGTITSGVAVVAGMRVILPGNKPIGCVYHDWYQDVRGKNLNYRMWPDGGHVVTNWYIEVPFVKTNVVQNTSLMAGSQCPLGNVSPVCSGNTGTPLAWGYTSWLANYDVNKKFTYLAVDYDDWDKFRIGSYVMPDQIGNFKVQNISASGYPTFHDTAVSNGSGCYITSLVGGTLRTDQTVGKIMAIDSRYPKIGLEDVQTYPDSNMPGTQTGGLPSFLYEFVLACQTLTGTTPNTEDIVSYVQQGYYGVARILLNVV